MLLAAEADCRLGGLTFGGEEVKRGRGNSGNLSVLVMEVILFCWVRATIEYSSGLSYVSLETSLLGETVKAFKIGNSFG